MGRAFSSRRHGNIEGDNSTETAENRPGYFSEKSQAFVKNEVSSLDAFSQTLYEDLVKPGSRVNFGLWTVKKLMEALDQKIEKKE